MTLWTVDCGLWTWLLHYLILTRVVVLMVIIAGKFDDPRITTLGMPSAIMS